MQFNNIFLDFLHRRKISDTVIKKFGVRFGMHSSIGECIIIPVADESGKFSFNKYRRNPLKEEGPKYLYDQGGKVTLYAFSFARESERILITEGENDCLVAWSANIPAVTSTGGAMSFQKDWADHFFDKEVIICFDNDSAGGEGMARVIEFIPHAKVLFLPDRPGVKDISDYVQNGGDLNELIKTAKNFTSLEEIIEDRSERISLWKSTFFHDAFIKIHSKPKTEFENIANRSIKSGKILRAKDYLVTDLIQFSQNKARCIFHNEDTASLHYYKDTNHCYCFGMCGKSFDSIEIYKKLHNCSFVEAVNALQ